MQLGQSLFANMRKKESFFKTSAQPHEAALAAQAHWPQATLHSDIHCESWKQNQKPFIIADLLNFTMVNCDGLCALESSANRFFECSVILTRSPI